MEKSHKKQPSGPYVPPAKRVKQEKLEDGSEEQQRMLWMENKRKITGLINRANKSNVTVIVKELFKCNLVRYKGLFASALLKAQEQSQPYTDVYAALLAIINTRIKNLGLLVINRAILNYRLAFMNDDKRKCLALVKFIAHLTNQEVLHEVLAFQVINHLIDKPTPSSIEIVIEFLKECGAKLEQLNPTYLFEVFRTLRDLSMERELETRTHEMIDMIHIIKKEKFKDHLSLDPVLDLVDESDRITHSVELTSPTKDDFKIDANRFKFDPNWKETEAKYEDFKNKLLGGEEESGSSSDSGEFEEESGRNDKVDETKEDIKPKIIDETGFDLLEFRKRIYLTQKSSLRHEEAVHKLLKAKIRPELHEELCQMIVDCCGQGRTYEPFLGLIAAKLCHIKRREIPCIFENIFRLFYETVHRFADNSTKVNNIAKFYANLLITESIDWNCLNCLRLREGATTSVGRCFIKFLFMELVSKLSLPVLVKYIRDPEKESAFSELFPKDKEEDIRFAINFFTCSNLGQLTEDLRQELVTRQELMSKQE